ncbi:peptide deformylase [Leptolyngbya sp. AN03gr2]|uniref:peptide deformylase n=1 Tax=unclassified Leptolyngbya TaxID=2650499 RepID=UPI003D31DA8F
MAEILDIIELGHPILREKARSIDNIKADRIQTLIDNLMATVQKANGVGIAAPQVAESYQLMIVASRPNLRYPNAPTMEPMPIINPKILAHSNETVKGWEGCLSIPGIRGNVPRYQAIELEFTDRFGKLQKMEMTDFVARIFQHEYDHFNGIVFVDRVESTRDLITEKEYQKIILTKE